MPTDKSQLQRRDGTPQEPEPLSSITRGGGAGGVPWHPEPGLTARVLLALPADCPGDRFSVLPGGPRPRPALMLQQPGRERWVSGRGGQ